MIVPLLCIVLTLCVLHLILTYNPTTRAVRKLPLPKEHFLVGTALDLLVSTVELFKLGRKYATELGDIYGWHSFNLRTVNIYTPKDIEVIQTLLVVNIKIVIQIGVYLQLVFFLGLIVSFGRQAVFTDKTTHVQRQKLYKMIVYLLCISLVLCVLHLLIKYSPGTRAVRQLPLPKENFLFGTAILVSSVELFNEIRRFAKELGSIYGWYSFMLRTVNILDPQDIETVVGTVKHSEKSIIYEILAPWLREGLLVSKGSKWLQRRRILTPAFHFNILKRFLTVMEDNSKRLVETLKKTNGESIDVIPVLSDYTLSAICETAMGTKLHDETSSESRVYKATIHSLGKCFVERMSKIYYFPDFIFHLSNVGRASKKYLQIVKTFTEKIIKERKEYVDKYGIKFTDSMESDNDEDMQLGIKKKKTAMLDLMIGAQKEGVIDSAGIQEEVDTFMFEGHDTTAAGLTFCLMELANHKDIQDKIYEELNQVLGNSSQPASIEELNSLKYLDCCIKESLRLYPPVPFIGRKLSEPVVLSGYKIPVDIQCHIHIYDLHRRADLYPNPNKFDPDRFLPENSMGRHPYAYIPFSAGPRNCIGQRFAMLEMKSCVAAVLRNFELHPVTTPEDLEFKADLVLRSNKPIYVKFVERTN